MRERKLGKKPWDTLIENSSDRLLLLYGQEHRSTSRSAPSYGKHPAKAAV